MKYFSVVYSLIFAPYAASRGLVGVVYFGVIGGFDSLVAFAAPPASFGELPRFCVWPKAAAVSSATSSAANNHETFRVKVAEESLEDIGFSFSIKYCYQSPTLLK